MAVAKRKRSARSGKRRAPMSPWMLLGGGLIAGIASTLLYDGVKNMKWSSPLDRFAIEKESVDDLPALNFEFYTLLPDQEYVVTTPKETPPPQQPAKPQEKQPSMAPSKTGAYYLQVGSFRERKTADSMRAKVTLLGTSGSIQQVRHNQNTWYRVRVGPYEQIEQVSAVQAQLKQHQINSLLVRAKP